MATAKGFTPFSGMVGVEKAWGSDSYLISIAEKCGINAIDLETLRDFCKERRLLLIVRSPGGAGRNVIGIGGIDIRPKPGSMKEKTGGRWIVRDGVYYVSDYDLLSVWQRSGAGYTKVPLGEGDARTAAFLKAINRELVMPLQHGANDDYLDCDGTARNLAIGEHFTIVPDDGLITLCESQDAMRAFYASNSLAPWLYG